MSSNTLLIVDDLPPSLAQKASDCLSLIGAEKVALSVSAVYSSQRQKLTRLLPKFPRAQVLSVGEIAAYVSGHHPIVLFCCSPEKAKELYPLIDGNARVVLSLDLVCVPKIENLFVLDNWKFETCLNKLVSVKSDVQPVLSASLILGTAPQIPKLLDLSEYLIEEDRVAQLMTGVRSVSSILTRVFGNIKLLSWIPSPQSASLLAESEEGVKITVTLDPTLMNTFAFTILGVQGQIVLTYDPLDRHYSLVADYVCENFHQSASTIPSFLPQTGMEWALTTAFNVQSLSLFADAYTTEQKDKVLAAAQRCSSQQYLMDSTQLSILSEPV